jgi:hypothetical protein
MDSLSATSDQMSAWQYLNDSSFCNKYCYMFSMRGLGLGLSLSYFMILLCIHCTENINRHQGRGQGWAWGGLAPAKLKVSPPPNKPQCSPPKESAQLVYNIVVHFSVGGLLRLVWEGLFCEFSLSA